MFRTRTTVLVHSQRTVQKTLYRSQHMHTHAYDLRAEFFLVLQGAHTLF